MKATELQVLAACERLGEGCTPEQIDYELDCEPGEGVLTDCDQILNQLIEADRIRILNEDELDTEDARLALVS